MEAVATAHAGRQLRCRQTMEVEYGYPSHACCVLCLLALPPAVTRCAHVEWHSICCQQGAHMQTQLAVQLPQQSQAKLLHESWTMTDQSAQLVATVQIRPYLNHLGTTQHPSYQFIPLPPRRHSHLIGSEHSLLCVCQTANCSCNQQRSSATHRHPANHEPSHARNAHSATSKSHHLWQQATTASHPVLPSSQQRSPSEVPTYL